MKINVEIDEEIKAIEVLIRNHEWNEVVQELMERLRERKRPYFVGRKGEMQHVFRAEEIICLFTEQDSIMVRTKQGIFEMKERLYELERDLPGIQFVRFQVSDCQLR
jgi:DNA-binding LytR/AlgR family response regulator